MKHVSYAVAAVVVLQLAGCGSAPRLPSAEQVKSMQSDLNSSGREVLAALDDASDVCALGLPGTAEPCVQVALARPRVQDALQTAAAVLDGYALGAVSYEQAKAALGTARKAAARFVEAAGRVRDMMPGSDGGSPDASLD